MEAFVQGWSLTIALCGFIADVEAQRRAPGQTQPTQSIQVALKVGGATYQSSEAGKCTHAPVASIFKTVAEMWSVQQNAGERSLALTLWKPKDGSGDMVTLSVTSGNLSNQVNTVRGGVTTGSGKVTLERSGNGGTFTVERFFDFTTGAGPGSFEGNIDLR